MDLFGLELKFEAKRFISQNKKNKESNINLNLLLCKSQPQICFWNLFNINIKKANCLDERLEKTELNNTNSNSLSHRKSDITFSYFYFSTFEAL